jgi:predicted SAM-dependent methyltransferase
VLAGIRRFFSKPTGPRDRGHFLELLRGSGIEIGALQNPVHAPHVRVKYVDRLPLEALLAQYPELAGQRIVAPDILDDAQDLKAVPESSQDFVIANHVIEHMANPIRALLSWSRALKVGGRLFLAVPDKRYTFDKARPYTAISHLFEDYENPSRDRDYAHFQEFALEVSCKTFNARPIEAAEAYARELWEKDYSIHYHVWDDARFREFLDAMKSKIDTWTMSTIDEMPTTGNEFIVVLEKRRSA